MNEFTFEDAMEISESIQGNTITALPEKVDYCTIKSGNTIYPLEESYMKLDNSDKVLAFLWEIAKTEIIDNRNITCVSKKVASLNYISKNCKYTVYANTGEKGGEWSIVESKEKTVTRTQVQKIIANLIEIGIVKEDEKYYYLDVDIDKLENGFSIIDDDTSIFLSNISNKDVIKIYTYLKYRNRRFNNYTFTKKNLATLLGYTINKQGKINAAVSYRIGNILYLLSQIKLIDVEIRYRLDEVTKHKYQYFVLKNVNAYNPENNKFNTVAKRV